MRLSASLLLLLALAACGAGAAPTVVVPTAGPTADSPAPAAEPRSLAVGYASLTPRLGVLFLAEELGLFRQQGLEVRSSYVKSASVAQAALAAGEIQVALAGLSAAMAARAAGADLVIVGGLLDRSISDLVVQPSIREPADLRGKRIGVNSLSGTVYTRTITVLDRLGLEPTRDNITIQAVGDEPTLAQALRAGAIDGATSPTRCRARCGRKASRPGTWPRWTSWTRATPSPSPDWWCAAIRRPLTGSCGR